MIAAGSLHVSRWIVRGEPLSILGLPMLHERLTLKEPPAQSADPQARPAKPKRGVKKRQL